MSLIIFRKWESFQLFGTGTEWGEKLDHKYSQNTTCTIIVNFEFVVVLNSNRANLNTPWFRFQCCLSGCDWPEYFPAGIRVWEKQVRTSVSRRPAAMCICRRRGDGGDSLSCSAGASVEDLPPLRQNAPTHKVLQFLSLLQDAIACCLVIVYFHNTSPRFYWQMDST